MEVGRFFGRWAVWFEQPLDFLAAVVGMAVYVVAYPLLVGVLMAAWYVRTAWERARSAVSMHEDGFVG